MANVSILKRLGKATAALILIVAVAACGSGESASTTEPTATTADTSQTTTTDASDPTTTAEPGYEGALQDVVDRGVLRVGLGLYNPFSIETPEGDYEGIDVEILTMLAEELGVEIEFQVVGYDVIVAGLQTDKYDITSDLITTEERKEAVTFADPLYEVGRHALVRSDNPKNPQSIEDLNSPEFTIIDVVGSADQADFQKYTPNATERSVPGFTNAQLVAEVVSGRVDACFIESPVNTRLFKEIYGDEITFIPPEDQPLASNNGAYAVKKGEDAFAEYISAFQESLREQGVIDEFFEKYAAPEFVDS